MRELDLIIADKTLESRFWLKVAKSDPDSCWPWLASTGSGKFGRYGKMVTSRTTGRITVRAHRLSYYFHTGLWPGDLNVCHACDNSICVNPGHLWLGDDSMNQKDCIEKGRRAHVCMKGADNPKAKLTDLDVIEIRKQIKNGEFNTVIADRFGVTHSNISAIRLGKSWKHQTLEAPP